MPDDYHPDDHWKFHGPPYQYVPFHEQDVLWYGGPGALEWHTPGAYEDKHRLTKCGLRFVYGLPPIPGASRYPDCRECHE